MGKEVKNFEFEADDYITVKVGRTGYRLDVKRIMEFLCREISPQNTIDRGKGTSVKNCLYCKLFTHNNTDFCNDECERNYDLKIHKEGMVEKTERELEKLWKTILEKLNNTPVEFVKSEPDNLFHDKIVFHYADNSDAFRNWLIEGKIPFKPTGHTTSFSTKEVDVFTLAMKWGVYKDKNKPAEKCRCNRPEPDSLGWGVPHCKNCNRIIK